MQSSSQGPPMSGVSPAHLPPGVPRALRAAVIGPEGFPGPAPPRDPGWPSAGRGRREGWGAKRLRHVRGPGAAAACDAQALSCPALPCLVLLCPCPCPYPVVTTVGPGLGEDGRAGWRTKEDRISDLTWGGAPRPSLPYTEPSGDSPKLTTWGHFGPPGEEHVAAPHSWSALTCARPSHRVASGQGGRSQWVLGLRVGGRAITTCCIYGDLWGMDPPSRRPQVSSFPGIPPPLPIRRGC